MPETLEKVKDFIKHPKDALSKGSGYVVRLINCLYALIDFQPSARSSEAPGPQSGDQSSKPSDDVGFIEKESGPPGTTNPVEIKEGNDQSKAAATGKKEEVKEKKMSDKEKAKLERRRQQEEAAKKKFDEERANVSALSSSPFNTNMLSNAFMKDYSRQSYGELPLNQSQERPNRPRDNITSFSNRVGETILIRARIQTSRAVGNKMVFLNFRQHIDTIQGLITFEEGKISKLMVKWVAGLPGESIVLVGGTVTQAQEEVKSATVKDVEIKIDQVCCLHNFHTRS